MKVARTSAGASLQDTLLHAEQVRLLYGGLPLALFSNVLLATLLVVVLWQVSSPVLVIAWLILMGGVLAWRGGTYLFYRRTDPNKPLHGRLGRFRAGAIASGVVWGAAALVLFPANEITHQVLLAFVLAGISAGAITSLAADRVSALGFIVPALLPLVLNFGLEGGSIPLSMSLMVVLFLVFLTVTSTRMQQNLYENMGLRVEAIEQQDALRESEQRFRHILDTCPTAVRIVRKGGREVIYSNPSYATLINTTPAQVIGVDPAAYYVHPEDYADILLMLDKGEQVWDRLVELKIPGDAETGNKWALATFLPIAYMGGPAVLGWLHDITRLIRIERMKSEFVATVSHELRTPLTAISGALGLISGGVLGELPVHVQKMLDIANKNSQRLSHLINDLLDIEKLSAGKLYFDMQTQALMPLIEQALDANRSYGAERRVTLDLASGLADACVSVDSQRLMQVLSNLLSNAIKYSPQDGRVEIAVEQRDTAVRVTVSDHGPGIPVEFRARIFQKFAQADSSDTRLKGGTGLGLAISRELVERMGGSIGFDSVAGEGAVFYFEFPLCPAPA
jgi:PAS domain S-box-containing protein